MKLNYLWNIGNNYEEGSKDLENLTILDVFKNICSEMEKNQTWIMRQIKSSKVMVSIFTLCWDLKHFIRAQRTGD